MAPNMSEELQAILDASIRKTTCKGGIPKARWHGSRQEECRTCEPTLMIKFDLCHLYPRNTSGAAKVGLGRPTRSIQSGLSDGGIILPARKK